MAYTSDGVYSSTFVSKRVLRRKRRQLVAGVSEEKVRAFWEQCKEAEKRDLKRLFDNNAYLLQACGKSLRKQVKELEQMGFFTTAGMFSRLRTGSLQRPCRVDFLEALSIYWGVPVWELMGRDMEAESRLLLRGH